MMERRFKGCFPLFVFLRASPHPEGEPAAADSPPGIDRSHSKTGLKTTQKGLKALTSTLFVFLFEANLKLRRSPEGLGGNVSASRGVTGGKFPAGP